jgi:hypothetical protein
MLRRFLSPLLIAALLVGCSSDYVGGLAENNQAEVNEEVNPTSAALRSPAVSYFNGGEAFVTITNVWGIPMDDENGPRTLAQVIVDMYEYLQDSTGGSPITVQEVDRAFLPGRSLHSIFNRLVSDPWIYDLIYEAFLEIARQKTQSN